jgi:hypothetical protein
MKWKYKPRKFNIPANICRDKGKASGDYYIDCALTGWRILASEAVKAPKYSGIDGLLVHRSYVYPPTQFYKPWPVLPTEQPVPDARKDTEPFNTNSLNTDLSIPDYGNNYNFREVNDPQDEL